MHISTKQPNISDVDLCDMTDITLVASYVETSEEGESRLVKTPIHITPDMTFKDMMEKLSDTNFRFFDKVEIMWSHRK